MEMMILVDGAEQEEEKSWRGLRSAGTTENKREMDRKKEISGNIKNRLNFLKLQNNPCMWKGGIFFFYQMRHRIIIVEEQKLLEQHPLSKELKNTKSNI